jgi:hypothetical protein
MFEIIRVHLLDWVDKHLIKSQDGLLGNPDSFLMTLKLSEIVSAFPSVFYIECRVCPGQHW